MATKELYNGLESTYRIQKFEEREQHKIARDQLPRGPAALLVILFDLLLRLDPR